MKIAGISIAAFSLLMFAPLARSLAADKTVNGQPKFASPIITARTPGHAVDIDT